MLFFYIHVRCWNILKLHPASHPTPHPSRPLTFHRPVGFIPPHPTHFKYNSSPSSENWLIIFRDVSHRENCLMQLKPLSVDSRIKRTREKKRQRKGAFPFLKRGLKVECSWHRFHDKKIPMFLNKREELVLFLSPRFTSDCSLCPEM